LKPLLKNTSAEWPRPALSTFYFGNHAVRSERWSYIRYRDGSEEFYDRRQDPNEWVNLASNPTYASAKAELARWLPAKDAPDVPDSKNFQFDPATATWRKKG
jgi:hypothetical protein